MGSSVSTKHRVGSRIFFRRRCTRLLLYCLLQHQPEIMPSPREIIKSFETRRLRTCSWRRKGDKSRAREKRRQVSRSCFTLHQEFMSRVLPVGR